MIVFAEAATAAGNAAGNAETAAQVGTFVMSVLPYIMGALMFFMPVVLGWMAWAHTKLSEFTKAKIDNPKIEAVVTKAEDLMFDAVTWGLQTLVDVYKRQGKWDDSAKKSVADEVRKKFLAMLGPEGLLLWAKRENIDTNTDSGKAAINARIDALMEGTVRDAKNREAGTNNAAAMVAALNQATASLTPATASLTPAADSPTPVEAIKVLR